MLLTNIFVVKVTAYISRALTRSSVRSSLTQWHFYSMKEENLFWKNRLRKTTEMKYNCIFISHQTEKIEKKHECRLTTVGRK